jgi:hypothetical protein
MNRERFEHNGKDYYLILIEPEDVGEVWPLVRDGVLESMVHSDSVMEGDDFLIDLEDGRCRLWCFVEGPNVVGHLISQIIRYPRKSFVRVLTMQCSGGEKGMLGMDLWHHFVPVIEEYGAREGCAHIEAWTRKGMVRSLEKHGWHNQFSIVTKPIEQMRIH